MKKIKLTREQVERLNKRLSEDIVKGGLNRVDNTFKKEFKKANVKLSEEETHEISEDAGGAIEILKHFADLVYNNPSQKGLSTFFQQNGITWGDISAYLTSVGILGVVAGGVHRVKNILKKRYTSTEEKLSDLPRIADIATKKIAQNPEELLTIHNERKGGKPTDLASKMAAQQKPESGWKKEPTGFNPDRFTPATKQDSPWTQRNQTSEDLSEAPDDDCQTDFPSKTDKFKGQYMNREIALLNSSDGSYMFDYGDIPREELPNPKCELDVEDVAMYVSKNYKDQSIIRIGNTIEDYLEGRADLLKLTEDVKQWLRETYTKDKKFVDMVDKLMETTTAASSGAYTGLFDGTPKKKDMANPEYTPAKQLEIVNDEEELLGGKITDEVIKEQIPIDEPSEFDDDTDDEFIPYDAEDNYTDQHYGDDEEFSQMMRDKNTSNLQTKLNRGYNMIGTGKWEDNKQPSGLPYPLKSTDVDLQTYLKLKKQNKIEEMTAAGSPTGDPSSTTTGQYVQPRIWAKDEKNWAGNKKTQYPGGEMVKFDPCTKLNNNKKAQSGRCSQGAVDKVVKTYKTKDSVISKNESIYEQIAAKTGRTIEEVKNLIENKLKQDLAEN